MDVNHTIRVMRKPVVGLSTRSDTNQAVQPQKMARDLEFQTKENEGLHYLCRENKGADQLRCYCAADLRICFHICKNQGFSCRGSNNLAQ